MKKRTADKKVKSAGRSKRPKDLTASKKGGATRGGLTLSSVRIGGTATNLSGITAIDPYKGASFEF